jgi:hypothetical protein
MRRPRGWDKLDADTAAVGRTASVSDAVLVARGLPHSANRIREIIQKSARSRSFDGPLNLRVLGSIPRRLTTLF